MPIFHKRVAVCLGANVKLCRQTKGNDLAASVSTDCSESGFRSIARVGEVVCAFYGVKIGKQFCAHCHGWPRSIE
jgi:hypothetical protein